MMWCAARILGELFFSHRDTIIRRSFVMHHMKSNGEQWEAKFQTKMSTVNENVIKTVCRPNIVKLIISLKWLARTRVRELELNTVPMTEHVMLNRKWKDIVMHYVHLLRRHCGAVEVSGSSSHNMKLSLVASSLHDHSFGRICVLGSRRSDAGFLTNHSVERTLCESVTSVGEYTASERQWLCLHQTRLHNGPRLAEKCICMGLVSLLLSLTDPWILRSFAHVHLRKTYCRAPEVTYNKVNLWVRISLFFSYPKMRLRKLFAKWAVFHFVRL